MTKFKPGDIVRIYGYHGNASVYCRLHKCIGVVSETSDERVLVDSGQNYHCFAHLKQIRRLIRKRVSNTNYTDPRIDGRLRHPDDPNYSPLQSEKAKRAKAREWWIDLECGDFYSSATEGCIHVREVLTDDEGEQG